jgi:hypothetical protein
MRFRARHFDTDPIRGIHSTSTAMSAGSLQRTSGSILYCFSAYPLKKAARSSGRSRARMPRAAFVALVAERRSRAN